jgi:hypothetical protein
MNLRASNDRYAQMKVRRTEKSGLPLLELLASLSMPEMDWSN